MDGLFSVLARSVRRSVVSDGSILNPKFLVSCGWGCVREITVLPLLLSIQLVRVKLRGYSMRGGRNPSYITFPPSSPYINGHYERGNSYFVILTPSSGGGLLSEVPGKVKNKKFCMIHGVDTISDPWVSVLFYVRTWVPEILIHLSVCSLIR